MRGQPRHPNREAAGWPLANDTTHLLKGVLADGHLGLAGRLGRLGQGPLSLDHFLSNPCEEPPAARAPGLWTTRLSKPQKASSGRQSRATTGLDCSGMQEVHAKTTTCNTRVTISCTGQLPGCLAINRSPDTLQALTKTAQTCAACACANSYFSNLPLQAQGRLHCNRQCGKRVEKTSTRKAA